MAIEVGIKGLAETTVTKELTAAAAGSGTLLVYGTPFMIALIENAASNSIQPYLEEGQSSVGISLNVSHDSATPVGMAVRAETVITAVEGRKITFSVEAFDETGSIGKGTHQRFVITEEKFLNKCYEKL